MFEQQRIENANKIIQKISSKNTKLELILSDRNKLVWQYTHSTKTVKDRVDLYPAKTDSNSSRNLLLPRGQDFQLGGTGHAMLAQIIRYVRKQPHLDSRIFFKYSLKGIEACEIDTHTLAKELGFDDKELGLTNCCICGEYIEDKDFVDFYPVKDMVAPACWQGRCPKPLSEGKVREYNEKRKRWVWN